MPSGGDEELSRTLYEELRSMAAARMRGEGPGHVLQPTALVHEAWIRMKAAESSSSWGRTHFYALAARTLRRVLVDHARARDAAKRGDGARHDELHDSVAAGMSEPVAVLDLEEALARLAELSAVR